MWNILIVDDHVLFREGLASLFQGQPDFKVLGEAGSVQEAIEKAGELNPDLILMDFNLPDGTGLDATTEILSKTPDTHIVFLTMHEEDDLLFAAIRSGAKGYLLKNMAVTKLLASLRGLSRGEALVSRVMTRRVFEEFARMNEPSSSDTLPLDLLTERETDVLRELCVGGSNREIANRLFISENTIKNHMHNILEKLHVTNRREAVRLAKLHRLQ